MAHPAISSSPEERTALLNASFSKESQNFITSDEIGLVKLWDFKGNELQRIRTDSFGIKFNVIAFSPDGQNILTNSLRGETKLWLTPKGFLNKRVHQFSLHELYKEGVRLEPEDLIKVIQKEEIGKNFEGG